jgi:hypothetical protein
MLRLLMEKQSDARGLVCGGISILPQMRVAGADA